MTLTDGSARKEIEVRASGQSVAWRHAARVCEEEGAGYYPAEIRPRMKHHEMRHHRLKVIGLQ